MKRNAYTDSSQVQREEPDAVSPPPTYGDLPNRLLTAFEVAEFVGCHEETVRRA